MSQEPESPDQGIVELEDQASPSLIPDDAGEAAEVESMVGAALLEELGTAPDEADAEFDEDIDDGEDDEALEDDAGDSDESFDASPPAPPSAEEKLARWVSQVVANPKSINQIPAKHHPAVMQALLQQERGAQERAVEIAHQYGLERGARSTVDELRKRQAVTEVDSLKQQDPTGYIQWREQFPDRAAAYDEVRTPRPQQAGADPRVASLQAVQAAAAPLRKQLDAHPAAKSQLMAKLAADPSRYGPTAAGLQQLAEDVAEAVAAERVAVRMRDEEPAWRAVEQRQAAAADRRATPRPDIGAGRNASGQLTDDVDTLLGMGLAGALQDRRRAVRA